MMAGNWSENGIKINGMKKAYQVLLNEGVGMWFALINRRIGLFYAV
jgi:hypothetical protein